MNHLGEQVLSQKTSDKWTAIVILQIALHGTALGESCISAHIIPMHCFGCVAGVDFASIGVIKSHRKPRLSFRMLNEPTSKAPQVLHLY